VTPIRTGLLVLTLVSGIGCARSVATTRDPSRASFPSHIVYRHYEAPRNREDGAATGGGLPLALTLDDRGNAWVLGEFHTHLQVVSDADSALAARTIRIPHHPHAAPFASGHGGPSKRSMLGEDLVVDRDGRVWISQGGGYLIHEGTNHSRVVSFDPESGDFAAYNLPGNGNEAMGLLWDERRDLIWVAESAMDTLVAFDPDRAPHDNEFLWNKSLDGTLCPEPTPEPAGCFARYPLPDGAHRPAQLVGDPSGAIWFTLFWGAGIGRLDPDSGEVIVYSLAGGIGTDPRAKAVGPGPWDIAISPDGEHVVWSEFFDSTVARIPLARALDPECRALVDDRNPCVEEMRIPGAAESQQVHSIAFDAFGNLWFTQFSFPHVPGVNNSIGFVTADWSRVELLDPLEIGSNGSRSYADIAIDPGTGDIWIAEFLPPGVGRLRLVNREVDPATW
jgi:streptogramin lyase